MKPHSKYLSVLTLIIPLLLGSQVYGQSLWKESEFIEFPDGTYEFKITHPDFKSIISAFAPGKKDMDIIDDGVVIHKSFVVYEKVLIGKRPFGKIRYDVLIREDDGNATCQFANYRFSRYERSARYARMMESRQSTGIHNAKVKLNEVQWGTIRWSVSQSIRGMEILLTNKDQIAP